MKLIYRVLLLLTLLVANGFAECEIVPTSLIDAENALASGEIDSLCFDRYRDLLLQPVDPYREGWRRIQELSYELEGYDFPPIAELLALPDSASKEFLIERHPQLEPFRALFELEQIETPLPFRGSVSSSISSSLPSKNSLDTVNTPPSTKLFTSLYSLKSRSGAEFSFRGNGDSLALYRRSFSVGSQSGMFRVSGGNITPQKRDLLWGKFQTPSKSGDQTESFLYGQTSGWNGFWGTINQNRISCIGGVHYQRDEELQTMLSTFQGNVIDIQAGVVSQKVTTRENIFSFSLNDQEKRFRIETDFSEKGGMALTTSARLHETANRGEIELWYVSPSYTPVMSRKIAQLNYRYDRRNSSVIGVRSRIQREGEQLVIRLNFNGELLNSGGREDLAITVAPVENRTLWSIKNRFYEFKTEDSHSRLWEITCKSEPKLNAFEFPIRASTSMEWGKWRGSSIHGGVQYNRIIDNTHRNFYECVARFRTYRSGSTSASLRLALKHQLKTFGRSSLSLEIPLNGSSKVKLHGKVEFLF